MLRIHDRKSEPPALTSERAVRTLPGTTPRRALRGEFPTQHPGQVADKFELSAAGSLLYKNRRLVGGEGGIRTLGTPQRVQRFSSAARPVQAIQGCSLLSRSSCAFPRRRDDPCRLVPSLCQHVRLQTVCRSQVDRQRHQAVPSGLRCAGSASCSASASSKASRAGPSSSSSHCSNVLPPPSACTVG
jgi:hypothetical protein